MFTARTKDVGAQQLAFAVGAGGDEFVESYDIAVDSAGASYITGYYEGVSTFGAGEANETTLFVTVPSFYAAKYKPDGTLGFVTVADGTGYSIGEGIALDRSGAMVVTGWFGDVATFGAAERNETTLTSGNNGFFVARYHPDGRLDFAVQGTGGNSRGNRVTVDQAGDILVKGTLSGSATFGAGEPNATTLDATGSEHDFVARYGADGTLRFALLVGGGNPSVGAIATDRLGASYVAGGFRGTAVFGAGEPNETTLTATGVSDAFIARHKPDGTLDFVVQIGGTDSEGVDRVAVDKSGEIAVIGSFRGTAIFGAGEPNETVLSATGDTSLFAARYRRDGTLESAIRAGAMAFRPGNGSAASGVVPDAAGRIAVTGTFQGTAVFGPGEPNETTLRSYPYSDDMFVARYRRDGRLDFAVKFGGEDRDRCRAIALDGAGAIYVTGEFRGDEAMFGAGGPNQTVLGPAGGSSAFVAKYAAAGEMSKQRVEGLIERVRALVAAGDLKRNRGWSLVRRLSGAKRQLRRNREVKACIALNGFVAKAESQVELGLLAGNHGQELIRDALKIVDGLDFQSG